MKKTIICLANSYKYGGRCVGGVEIELDKEKAAYKVKRDSRGIPIWIRPISSLEHGEIPSSLVDDVRILDVLEIDVLSPCPNSSHSENYKYSSIKKLSNVKKSASNLNGLCDTYHDKIFYNRGKAVPNEVFENGNYSLMFIKPDKAVLYKDFTNDELGKLRMKITHNDNVYDLPVTDPVFLSKKEKFSGAEQTMGDCYLTVSLGEEWDEWHYKLIAGVIEM